MRFTEHGAAVGPAFDWAHVGPRRAARAHAEVAGYSLEESWSSDGRTFAALVRVDRPRIEPHEVAEQRDRRRRRPAG